MMSEPQRSLRVRKNPKYLNSDVTLLLTQEQDPDKVSFAQLKSHHVPSSLTQDYNSAQNQKAQDAKILLKFIQKINKSTLSSYPGYKTYVNQMGPNAPEAQKQEQAKKDKKIQISQDAQKKLNTQQKQTKKQAPLKNKSAYSTKTLPNQSRLQISKPPETNLNTLRQMNTIPPISGIGKGIFTDQLKKLQSLYPEMKNINYQSLTQNINPNLFSGAPVQKKKQPQPKSVFPEQKLFKRSAYHVAIAYHIYLKNLKEKGGVIGNQIDPTYHARKLKEGRPLE